MRKRSISLLTAESENVINTVDMGGKVRATPVVANGVLYVMTENKLYAIKTK